MATPITIPLSYNPIDISKLSEVLTRYDGVHHNQIVADFERTLSETTGAPHVVALNSGTSAIHLALKVLGVEAGDYVIVPTFTYVATINPVRYLGAIPVFIDSEPETWNMNPHLLEQAIQDLKREGKPLKAIILVHTYGMPCKLDDILQLADYHKIPVVEDAAESLGSTYRGQQVGTFGDIGIYSFNNNKIVTTYGGGALVAKRPDWIQKARFYASQAREQLPYYEHKEVGYNLAMSPLCAASGITQLPELGRRIKDRREIFEYYSTSLSGYEVQFQSENEDNRSNRWLSAVLFKDLATKDRVTSVLASEGIETRPLWRPMHDQPVFLTYKKYANDLSMDYFNRGLCLPSGGDLQAEALQKVVELLKQKLGYK
ncbi:MAG: aminotransferase class I/II-fold pyridoxal phosphate-dependent enzyme [Cyclobacteriaceae bacterium]